MFSRKTIFLCGLLLTYSSDSCQELTFLPFGLMLQMSKQKYDFSALTLTHSKTYDKGIILIYWYHQRSFRMEEERAGLK